MSSEVLDPPVMSPVSGALDALESAVGDLAGAQLWTAGNGELVETVARVHRLMCRTDAALHAMVREVDARGAAIEAGAPSTAAWLRGRLRLHPGAAKRLVTTARSLHEDPAGPLVPHDQPGDASEPNGPDTPGGEVGGPALLRAAFAAGDVGAEHAAVACETLGALPPGVDPATVRAAERYLVEQARVHDPKALAHLGRHLRHVLDPEHGDNLGDEEEHHVATRHLDVRQRRDGSSDLRGHLDLELTATLLAQLHALGAPRPAVDGVKDQRTLGQRNADALADLLRIASGKTTTTSSPTGPDATGPTATGPTAGPDTTGSGSGSGASNAGTGSGGLPTRHGARPCVTITMALETLQRRIGAPAAMLDWAGPISAEAARRIACDARIIPVVLGAHGEPLDVGRASYPVTTAIWRALVARDNGCAFAGCDRPPEWTEAHHRIHWEDGGETSVTNCCLLCDHHHRSVHHHGWRVELIDGVIHTIPPPWVDPDQVPRRNTGRVDLAALATCTESPD